MRSILTAALLGLCVSTASAAPFLRTKASFITSSFCKVHSCKLVAKVPSDRLDQFHYDVDGSQRVVVWRVTSDQKRRWGPENAKYVGIVHGVSMVWYGIQDTPGGIEKLLAQLVTFATGKAATPEIVSKWFASNLDFNENWGDSYISATTENYPGGNALIWTMMIDLRGR